LNFSAFNSTEANESKEDEKGEEAEDKAAGAESEPLKASRVSRRAGAGDFSTRAAGGSVKPGVERSGTPGTLIEKQSPRSGRQRLCEKRLMPSEYP
jgi:hypothetical protein